MSTYPAIYAATMTDQQRALYYAELSVVQKDEVLGVLLAVFLGTFGAHHFYLRRTGLGILYCILSVTGFSSIAGLIEAFFMPERVRRFNAMQSHTIAARLGIYPVGPVPTGAGGLVPAGAAFGVPASPQAPAAAGGYGEVKATATCSSCGAELAPGVKFCSRCGSAVNPSLSQS